MTEAEKQEIDDDRGCAICGFPIERVAGFTRYGRRTYWRHMKRPKSNRLRAHRATPADRLEVSR